MRFDEWVFDKNGVQLSYTHWEWIVSWKITKKNAPYTACRGRMRWLEEDLFNTLKNVDSTLNMIILVIHQRKLYGLF